ncbi:uncharacterized protein isoform X2 [Choristoneura fumiferana]|uniref:uncharacterized protein n=1 Tax=Choristoneura fumiferana TaxID=7141 RepID=UPI003D15DD53
MSNLGQIKPYSEGDDVDCFLERIEQYFKANDVAATKQVSTLLMLIDEKSYKTLKSMFHPSLPKDKSYADLEGALRLRFRPRVSYYRKRAVFDKAIKNEVESVSKWYERVREMAAECEFGTDFEQRVKDKFVTGFRSGQIFERLCEEPISKAIADLLDIALNKESALLERPENVYVNKVKAVEKRVAEADVLLCVHCGKPNHSFAKCKYKTYKCKSCGKIGHLALVCKSKPTHTLEVQEEEDESGFNQQTVS